MNTGSISCRQMAAQQIEDCLRIQSAKWPQGVTKLIRISVSGCKKLFDQNFQKVRIRTLLFITSQCLRIYDYTIYHLHDLVSLFPPFIPPKFIHSALANIEIEDWSYQLFVLQVIK